MKTNLIINSILDKTFKYSGLRYLYFKNKKNKNKCPVLTYHSLNPKIDGVPQNLFEEHVRYLSSNYNIITLNEAFEKVVNKRLNGDELVITFDDGYEDNLIHAFPILNKYNATATIFIISGLIDKYYRDQKMLNKKQIIELKREGIEIGSHTVTHPNLTVISKDQLKEELIQSKNELETIIGDKVTSFAYPGGIYDKNVIDMCKKIGYKIGCTIFHDFYIDRNKQFEIPRITIYTDDSIFDIQAKINGNRHWITPLYKLYYPYYHRI